MAVTSVRIQPDIEERLGAISERLHRSRNWLINQALREFIARETETAERWKQTLAALESVAQGNVVQGDVVHEWLESWGSSNELPAPKVPE
ncbi:MAG: ribbon-helix-helix protein, CopG family [Lysobacteraceae bacterium]|uniref:CopG family ribbon-helix-helix protein n=1 Tax=Denitratimonas sp. CY0512 TaxID=3131940 RepID=UPI0030A3DBD3